MRFENLEEYKASPMFQLIQQMATEKAGVCSNCEARATEVDLWADPPMVRVDEKQPTKFPAWCAFNLPAKLTVFCSDCHRRIAAARKLK